MPLTVFLNGDRAHLFAGEVATAEHYIGYLEKGSQILYKRKNAAICNLNERGAMCVIFNEDKSYYLGHVPYEDMRIGNPLPQDVVSKAIQSMERYFDERFD